ncbi:putative peptidoglycan binding domain protein [Achromobacter piechaudii ATCC 43553]|uniref:Putative peptidoglycan binding domain protein n=2 Tax=Achromobacter piechaudii TaxID=72556 RepID=D4XCF3_9BURK|nr:putative peptidoglycan binding domain protein [Achromobacter piechaudii ATCC 43553]
MMSDYGSRPLSIGMQGADVEELQLRLAGFRGTLLDGEFGPGTTLQVSKFQADFMGKSSPSGVADTATFEAIDAFADNFSVDFSQLQCRCGECEGFGRGKFKGKYLGNQKTEAFHLYEYPGIHRMLLWAVRAARFYMPEHRFSFSSGYRCSADNQQHHRNTTNHCGKAVDLDIALRAGETKQDDAMKCHAIRGRLVELSNAQVGWAAKNRKSLEPDDVAPTWVHYDVRSYEPRYLEDRYFCRDLAGLNARAPILF